MLKFFGSRLPKWRKSSPGRLQLENGTVHLCESEYIPDWEQKTPVQHAVNSTTEALSCTASTQNPNSLPVQFKKKEQPRSKKKSLMEGRKHVDTLSANIYWEESSLSEKEFQRMLQEENKRTRRSSLHLFSSTANRTSGASFRISTALLSTEASNNSNPLPWLISFTSLAKESELKSEIINAAFSKMVQFITNARTGGDFTKVCHLVRRLLGRRTVRICFGLVFLSNPDLQRQVIAVMEDTAFEFQIRLENYCHDNYRRLFSSHSRFFRQYPYNSYQSSLDPHMQHCNSNFDNSNGIRTIDQFPIHLPSRHWNILSLLVMLGRLLAEANIDLAIHLATNQLFSRCLARVLVEGLSFHAAMYFIGQTANNGSFANSTISEIGSSFSQCSGSGEQFGSFVSPQSCISSREPHQPSHLLVSTQSQQELDCQEDKSDLERQQLTEASKHSGSLRSSLNSLSSGQHPVVSTPAPIALAPDPLDLGFPLSISYNSSQDVRSTILPLVDNSQSHDAVDDTHSMKTPLPIVHDDSLILAHHLSSRNATSDFHVDFESLKIHSTRLKTSNTPDDVEASKSAFPLTPLLSCSVLPLSASLPSGRGEASYFFADTHTQKFQEPSSHTDGGYCRQEMIPPIGEGCCENSEDVNDSSPFVGKVDLVTGSGLLGPSETVDRNSTLPPAPSYFHLNKQPQGDHECSNVMDGDTGNDHCVEECVEDRSDGVEETGRRTNVSKASSLWEGAWSPKPVVTGCRNEVETQAIVGPSSVENQWHEEICDTHTIEQARREAMRVFPRSVEAFIFGSVFLDISSIPDVEKKMVLILDYLAEAEECNHLAVHSGLLLLDAILSSTALYKVVSSSTAALSAMLHLFERIVTVTSLTSKLLDHPPSSVWVRAKNKGGRNRPPVKSQSNSSPVISSALLPSHQNQPTTEHPRRSLWLHFFHQSHRKQLQPEDMPISSLNPEEQQNEVPLRDSSDIVEVARTLATTFLLKLGGACKYHHYHVTDAQTRPTHFGIPVESLVASNWSGRPTRGMLSTCNYPSIASLRSSQDSVHRIVQFLAESRSATPWQVAAEMKPLEALLVIENLALVSKNSPWIGDRSARVATKFEEYSHCCYCGKNYAIRISNKAPKRVPFVVCTCNFVRYCSEKCLKLDAGVHQFFCHMVQVHCSSNDMEMS